MIVSTPAECGTKNRPTGIKGERTKITSHLTFLILLTDYNVQLNVIQ